MNKDHRQAIREAAEIYSKKDTFDGQQKEEAVRALETHDVWSLAQVEKITGVPRHQISKTMTKSDRTGGRLNPDTFELLLEEIALKDRGETNNLLTARIAQMGTSPGMIAKLIGHPISSVKWRIDKGKGLLR